MNPIKTISLPNGSTLLIEENNAVRSAALSWLLPIGNSYDHPKQLGSSAILSDWIWRGAANLNTKQLSNALDRIGLQRGSGVQTHHLHLSATMIGDRLPQALPLLTSIIRQPTLHPDTFQPVRDLCLQSIESLRDDPQSRAMMRLKENHFPPPDRKSVV